MRAHKDAEMVECHYKGTVINIPEKIFLEAVTDMQFEGKKFIRYKEGARLYSMSEREFYSLAHEAGAVYKKNGIALVKPAVVDEYLEGFREETREV